MLYFLSSLPGLRLVSPDSLLCSPFISFQLFNVPLELPGKVLLFVLEIHDSLVEIDGLLFVGDGRFLLLDEHS